MIALAFWGLTRSTFYTFESIRKHIFSQLPPHFVFVHTYSSNEPYLNERANESSSSIAPDYEHLQPYRVEIDDVDETKLLLDLPRYHSQPDPWKTNYATVDNFVLAMYSKQRVTEMVAKSGITFSSVIFLRPDVRYLTSIKSFLHLVSPNTWVIPSFHNYNGFNDRFCIASPTNYRAYGCVLALLLPYSKRKPLHSETFYAEWAKTLRIELVRIPFFFQRVRMSGETDPKDLFMDNAVRHISAQPAHPQNVELHDRVDRHLPVRSPVRHPFALRFRDRVPFVRKPTGVVPFNVRI